MGEKDQLVLTQTRRSDDADRGERSFADRRHVTSTVVPSNGTALAPNHGTGAMGMLRMVHWSLRGRYHWAILLGMLTGAACGWLGWRLGRPVYHSEGLVRIAYTLPEVTTGADARTIPNFENFMQSQRMLICSRRII